MKIKRYDPKLESNGWDNFSVEMEESEIGDYVKYSDVEHLIHAEQIELDMIDLQLSSESNNW